MEYMYLVSSPCNYVLGAKPIGSYAAENASFSAADGLIREKGCKEMSPPSKTEKKSLKRKTRKKAKRNKSHNVVSSSYGTSAGSSVLDVQQDEANDNGRSTAEKSRTSVVAAASGFSSRKDHARHKKMLSGATADVRGHQQPMSKLADSRTLLPRRQLKGSSNTATRTGSGVTSLHRQTGKENSYSVWQKVQRNDLPVSGSYDIDKGSSICSKLGLACKDEVSFQRKVSKEKASKKSKRKKSLHFKEGILEQNGMLGVFNHANDQNNMVKCVPRISYKNSYFGSGSQTLKVERTAPDATGFVNGNQGITETSMTENCTADKETSASEFTKVDQTNKEAETAEFNKQSHGSACVLQKWIPIGIKEPELKKLNWDVEIPDQEIVASDFLDLASTSPMVDTDSTSEDTAAGAKEDCVSLGDECVGKTSDSDDSLSRQTDQDVAKACLVIPTCYQDLATFGVRLEGIVRAVHDTLKVQLASEAIEFATGCPIAEFERLLHSSSPSVSQSSSLLSCQTGLPDISLQSLWQWYEKHGIYGLEVRAEDHQNSSRLGIDQLSFRAYFVPFLSAIQLFGATEERKETQNNDSVHHATESAWTDDGELLFEYFEFERPQLRQPLYEKIHELARGDGIPGRKMFGNPSTLVSTSLPELHKKSWYSVAWYPIYKIPDGSLRAAFLTYHSFGHLVERKAGLGSPTMVCPVVGLQSYNAQDECWFQPRHSAADHQTEEGMLGSSKVLNERLRTLKDTASCMARATVKKGEEKPAKNWHPDYEFFLSRQLY